VEDGGGVVERWVGIGEVVDLGVEGVGAWKGCGVVSVGATCHAVLDKACWNCGFAEEVTIDGSSSAVAGTSCPGNCDLGVRHVGEMDLHSKRWSLDDCPRS